MLLRFHFCVSGSVFDTRSLVHQTKAHAYLGLISANVFKSFGWNYKPRYPESIRMQKDLVRT